MTLRVVNHDREVGKERDGMRARQCVEQVQEESSLHTIPHTMGDGPGAQVQRPRQRALRVGARGHHFNLLALGHPLISDLGQQIDIQLVSKEEGRAGC